MEASNPTPAELGNHQLSTELRQNLTLSLLNQLQWYHVSKNLFTIVRANIRGLWMLFWEDDKQKVPGQAYSSLKQPIQYLKILHEQLLHICDR